MNQGSVGIRKAEASAASMPLYLFQSRLATHVLFWLGYYLLFSIIWMKPELGYFHSFYLEFVLLPPRLLAVYVALYYLLPRFLFARRYGLFLLGYLGLMLVCGLLQRVFHLYFYQSLLELPASAFWDLSGLMRSVVLVNTTALFVASVKVFQQYLLTQEQLLQAPVRPVEIKANRRTHLVAPEDILYVEGMGNYVSYHLTNGEKLVAYGTIKAALDTLPDEFLRLHKSYIVNRHHIDSFNQEDISLGDKVLPRGKDVSDDALLGLYPASGNLVQ